MRLIHSADWHLDAPFSGLNPELARSLRKANQQIPGLVADLCKQLGAQLLLLSGDLFDREPAADTLEEVCQALGSLSIPVVIAPGNHDYFKENGCYSLGSFPKNVHIFQNPQPEALELPELDCTIYGAGYRSMDCPPLLEGFRADCRSRYALGVFHADPTHVSSPYCPVTAAQVRDSGLDYLALGHVHSRGSFRGGSTLCAWPGCPMGHGFDETGEKGVLCVDLEAEAQAQFIPLGLPRFLELEIDANGDPREALLSRIPAGGGQDVLRITLTGEADPKLVDEIPNYVNVILRDRTSPPGSLWGSMEDDSLEGLYFRLLHDSDDPELARLAARISRRILDGREVELP